MFVCVLKVFFVCVLGVFLKSQEKLSIDSLSNSEMFCPCVWVCSKFVSVQSIKNWLCRYFHGHPVKYYQLIIDFDIINNRVLYHSIILGFQTFIVMCFKVLQSYLCLYFYKLWFFIWLLIVLFIIYLLMMKFDM